MNAALHENRLDCYSPVYTGQKTFEITGESVVPDKLPDIGLLGETSAHVLLRSKETSVGAGRMEGELDTTVCYIPDGTAGFCKLELHLPWQVEFEGDGVTDRCMAVGNVTVLRVETRMLNPRKVLVKAQLCADFECFDRGELSICDGLVGESLLQIRKETLDCSMISTVCERSFVATDEYPVPPDLVGGEILCKSVQLRVDDVKTLANKLIVKGSALSDVVIASSQGGAENLSFTSGFSFIAETDCDNVSPDVKVRLMPTAMYYELSDHGQVLSVEVHGVCQMLAYSKDSVTYISDAFSNFYDCNLQKRPVTVYRNLKASSQRETVTQVIACRSQISQVQFVTVAADTPMKSGEGVQIPLRLGACVQYENGAFDWQKKQVLIPVRLQEGEQVIAVRVADVHAVGIGSEVECRAVLELELQQLQESQLQTICGIVTDEECPCMTRRPSLTLVRTEGSLWELARRYGSTEELIQTYNELDEDYVDCSKLLLIPKQHK